MSELIKSIQENPELIKHSAAVHISNVLTVTARKTANVLLKNAFHNLDSQEYHRISLADIAHLIGLEKSNNYQPIKDALDTLVNTTITWNIFDQDNKVDWSAKKFTMSKIIASVHYDENNGYCDYSYSYHLKDLLKNPNIYAKINLLIQREFKGKHALALWELLVETLCRINKSDVYTDWFSLDSYRKFLGLGKDEYSDFRNFNKFLVKTVVAEVNQVSNIYAEVEYKKEGRRVSAIRFRAIRKDDLPERAAISPVKDGSIQASFNFEKQAPKIGKKNIDGVELLLKSPFNLSDDQAAMIAGYARKYDVSSAQLSNALEAVKENIESDKGVVNIIAQIKAAISEGWQPKYKTDADKEDSSKSALMANLSNLLRQQQALRQTINKIMADKARSLFFTLPKDEQDSLVSKIPDIDEKSGKKLLSFEKKEKIISSMVEVMRKDPQYKIPQLDELLLLQAQIDKLTKDFGDLI